MSGIAGILNLDGQPVDRARMQRMVDAMAHRGADGTACWIDGAIGLGHAMLRTTPESRREQQPLADRRAALYLTLDGRIDNRGELRLCLQGRGLMLPEGTDAELVVRAYECWGERCPEHILGDYAFAIWDARKRSLFCARDALGIKPFYYFANERSFIFGSELQQLFEGADFPCEPNEGMIGEYLANAITNREETLYRGILRLPPAHCLRVGNGRLQLWRYWDADPSRAINYRTDAEYAEHFLDIFRDAVRCRLRSHGGIGAELSGGLDSSSVVSVVQSLRQGGTAPDTQFETFSLVFPGMACDESSYIGDVIKMSGAKGNLVNAFAPQADCHEEYLHRHRDFPGYPQNYMWNSIRALAREKGFRVHLTGLGGDDWLTGDDSSYTELLLRARIRHLLRRARRDAQTTNATGILPVLFAGLRQELLSLAPPAAIRLTRKILGRQGVPNWIDPDFARKIHLRERLERKPDHHAFSSHAQRDQYRWLNGGYLVHSFEYDDRAAAEAGVEMRHPFHDRRIVEFTLAIPREQLWRQGQIKFLLREAMRGVLPESVRSRQDKADFSHSVAAAFPKHGYETLLDMVSSESARWIDRDKVFAMFQQMLRLYGQADKAYADLIWPPWAIFGICLWYKMFFANRGNSIREIPMIKHDRPALI